MLISFSQHEYVCSTSGCVPFDDNGEGQELLTQAKNKTHMILKKLY